MYSGPAELGIRRRLGCLKRLMDLDRPPYCIGLSILTDVGKVAK